jgi:3-oxoacyl-[acyl-carrier protein] reductase
MDLELLDKNVFVAGSSRGIGRAIAKGFLAEGARVAISGRDEASLKGTKEELRAAFPESNILSMGGDLTDEGTCVEAMAAISEAWGALDVLVVNFGSGSGRTGWEYDEESWGRLYEINFFGAARLVSHALPSMLARKSGSIVLVSSITGIESTPAPLAYSSAKAALINYSKNLARQVAADGIRVNAIAPGNIFFPGGTWEKHLANDAERVENYIQSEVPMKRFGNPEEIADAVLYLSSARAAFVTGACLVADGGQTRTP